MRLPEDLALCCLLYTSYYQHWNAVLNSEKIDKILKEYNLELIFYPHRNMQKYIEAVSYTHLVCISLLTEN